MNEEDDEKQFENFLFNLWKGRDKHLAIIILSRKKRTVFPTISKQFSTEKEKSPRNTPAKERIWICTNWTLENAMNLTHCDVWLILFISTRLDPCPYRQLRFVRAPHCFCAVPLRKYFPTGFSSCFCELPCDRTKNARGYRTQHKCQYRARTVYL